MPIPLINLDDRSYDDLVAEAIGLIPVEAPEWTDHNPSDTGVVLIELLAWLTEMVLYRVNQIPEQNQAVFLSLLKGQPWQLPADHSVTEQTELLQAEIQSTLVQLRHPYRAVTVADFERLILSDWLNTRVVKQQFREAGAIARVNCLLERDLDHFDINQLVPGHISLVVLPRHPQPNTELLRKTLKRFLDQRRLISTRLHVVDPSYVKLTVSATLYLQDSANFRSVQAEAKRRIQAFFAPIHSQEYWQGQGYPFGANVYLSEFYQLLDDVPGVDYVEQVELTGFEAERQEFNDQHQLIGVAIHAHEFVEMTVDHISTFQRFGDKWKRNG